MRWPVHRLVSVARVEYSLSQMYETSIELAGDCEIVITRTLHAPARIVFDAWTRPDLLKRWYAPRSHRMTVACYESDLRAGGTFRYVLRRDTGDELAFCGTYSEVVPDSRLVYTHALAAMNLPAASLDVTFTEQDGSTELVIRVSYPSKQARDGALATGMEASTRETLDQLAEFVASPAHFVQ